MKLQEEQILIDFDGIKRAFAVPFGICCSRRALEYIVEELQSRLAEGSWTYGWTFVRVPYPTDCCPQKPISWRDAPNGLPQP